MKKWQWRLPGGVAVWGLLLGGTALAESSAAPMPEDAEHLVYSADVAGDAEFARHAFFQEDQQKTPFREELPQTPVPDEAYDSPSDDAPDSLPWDDAGIAVASDQFETCDAGCGGRCDTCGRGSSGGCYGDSCGRRGISIGGWIDQGITVNGFVPADRFNGPVTFNDRDSEYQLNQLWVYAEREVDTGGYGWDIGGRIDFVYGTDRRFTQALGLEDDWNSDRFYGAALPQLYLDVGVNNLTVRMGHYYTIIGYEGVRAPDNFFYSHAYTMQYGEPFTHTGLLASYAPGDGLKISAGFDRGWNNWEDNNTNLSFLGGISGESCDGRTSLAFAVTAGEYDDAGQSIRNMYSVVFSHQVTDRFRYVLQHDYGTDRRGAVQIGETTWRDDAEWYGINQYFLYDINPCWGLGLRFEWFRDDDGTRVGGIGAPNGWTLGPDIANNQIGWAGDFYAITCGVNWKPTERIIVRPEWRWDWYDGPVDYAGRLPYDFGSRGHQFTFGTDLIITF